MPEYHTLTVGRPLKEDESTTTTTVAATTAVGKGKHPMPKTSPPGQLSQVPAQPRLRSRGEASSASLAPEVPAQSRQCDKPLLLNRGWREEERIREAGRRGASTKRSHPPTDRLVGDREETLHNSSPREKITPTPNKTAKEASVMSRAQYHAGRLVTGAAVRTPYLEVLQKLGWDSLATRRDYHRLVTMYKLVHGPVPPHLQPLVPTTRDANSQSQLRLRNAHHLHIPRSRTNTYKNSFFLYTARLWNRLPSEVTGARCGIWFSMGEGGESFEAKMQRAVEANNRAILNAVSTKMD
ncbi:hypothetical protein Bbelb_187800 [Branchiostoma belcheri]|nr:hypothetical protein Bbelb_187800 [Branchiostoma belcheri]